MSRKRQKKIFSIDVGKDPTVDTNKILLNKHTTTTFTHHNLLHSDKSTNAISNSNAYFYNNKQTCKLSNTSFLSTSIPLLGIAFTLLLVVGLAINPSCDGDSYAYAVEGEGVTPGEGAISEETVNNVEGIGSRGTEGAKALSTNDAAISLSLPDYGGASEVTVQKELSSSNSAGYLSVDFNVEATNVDKYDVYVQANKNTLVGDATGSTIASITRNTSYSNIADSTEPAWGYAVAKGSQVDPTTLTYLPVQTTAITAADSGSATDTTVQQNYTLAFAANLTKALADHYKASITLSVAAGAGQVATLYSVEYISNGGSNIPAAQEVDSLDNSYNFTVPSDIIPKRDGYSFRGWTTNSADSTGPNAELLPGDTVSLTVTNPNQKLYAVWLKASDFTNLLASAGSMQGMTSEICAATTTPKSWDDPSLTPTARLTDSRDNKQYWIAKLADGNCWMTQNLDLDLVEGKALTPADSDVTEDWIPGVGEGTIAEGNLSAETWSNSESQDDTIRSYDAGMYVYTRPTVADECGAGSGVILADCTDEGWANVSGTDGIRYEPSNNSNDEAVIIDTKDDSGLKKVYNAHYLVGNYYNWGAATAGQFSESLVGGENATQSICPAGWGLPQSGRAADKRPTNQSKSFAKLFSVYGWKWEDLSTIWFKGYYADYTKLGKFDLRLNPFYYVYAGFIEHGRDRLKCLGGCIQDWSATVYNRNRAYNLSVELDGNVFPAFNNAFHIGYSVRCVAK